MYGLSGGGFAIPASPHGVEPSKSSALANNHYSVEHGGSDGQVAGSIVFGQPADLTVNVRTGQGTVNIWFMRTEAADFQRCIVSKARMGTGGTISVFLGMNASGQLYCLLGSGNFGQGGSITLNTWHMATVVWSGGTGRLFLDGVQVCNPFVTGVGVNTDADWIIGAARFNNNTDSSYEFRGYTNNLTTWSIALSQDQIAELYGAGTVQDPTTHSASSTLTHWLINGTSESWPSIADHVGSATGTAFNMPGVRFAETAPGHVASSLPRFNGSDANNIFYFDATDWTSGSWVATNGGFTAVQDVGGTPVRSAAGPFSGHFQITVNRLFRIAASASLAMGSSFQGTFLARIYTGALDGSGGFFLGYYDGNGVAGHTDSCQIYNLFYAEDVAFRIQESDGSTNRLTAEFHDSKHPNSYIEVAVTVDLVAPLVKVYCNGSLEGSTNSLAAGYSPPATAAFGICGNAAQTGSGFASNANGGQLMACQMLNRIMTDTEIAMSAAPFNALKGYI